MRGSVGRILRTALLGLLLATAAGAVLGGLAGVAGSWMRTGWTVWALPLTTALLGGAAGCCLGLAAALGRLRRATARWLPGPVHRAVLAATVRPAVALRAAGWTCAAGAATLSLLAASF